MVGRAGEETLGFLKLTKFVIILGLHLISIRSVCGMEGVTSPTLEA